MAEDKVAVSASSTLSMNPCAWIPVGWLPIYEGKETRDLNRDFMVLLHVKYNYTTSAGLNFRIDGPKKTNMQGFSVGQMMSAARLYFLWVVFWAISKNLINSQQRVVCRHCQANAYLQTVGVYVQKSHKIPIWV